ncbi:MAG: YciI family protein [Chloroflexi bacterium]|jgi:hypothetical protein|nr:YciI family protein [Chloroflexota bacterium]
MSNAEIPPGVGVEQVWALEATYAPDGAEARAPYRAEHLERIARLTRAGIVIEAGAFTDVSRSIVLLRAESEEAALAIAREDPYTREGVWVEIRVAPFGRVVVEATGTGA